MRVFLLLSIFCFAVMISPQGHAQDSMRARAEGRVLDAATGAPIAGALVTVTGGYVVATAADGTWSLASIALTGDYGIVSVEVTAANYGTYTLRDTAIFANDTLLLTVQLGTQAQVVEAGGLLDQFGRELPDEITDPLPQADGIQPQFWSHSVIPPTIRVAITGRTSCGYRGSDGRWVYYPIQRVDVVDFRQYVKNVLPSEWISTWNGQSHRAGAMAVKMYAWWKMNIGPRTIGGFTFDVWGDTCDQMYIAGREFASTNGAVDDTWNYLMRRDGQVFKIHYTSTDDVCRANNLSPCMAQWGSKALGDQGYDWQYILNYYYAPVEITYGAGAPPGNTNLVRNGTFADGFNGWAYGGDMPAPATTGGVLSAARAAAVSSGWAAVFQDLGYGISAAAPFEVTVRLNNTSAAIKDVQIALRSAETWAGALSCTFALPAGAGFQSFTLRGLTTANWANLRVEIDLLTPDSTLQADDVTVQYRPGAAIYGTECIRPAPVNDLYANWTTIPAGGGVLRQSLAGATVSGDDPALACLGGQTYSESVWFRFTPSAAGTVQINTAGSGVDAVLGVFTEAGRTAVACSDNYSVNTTAAYLTFNASAGTPYVILAARRGAATGSLTLAVNRIGLLEPGSSTRADFGNPTFVWTDVATDYYYFYVQTRVGQQVINEVLVRESGLCSDGLCRLDATRLRERYRLLKGAYEVYLNSWRGGTAGEVVGPFSFTLDAQPPALVTMTEPEAVDTLRPVITWTLDAATSSATSFWVYVALSSNRTKVYHQSYTRTQACGSTTGTTCSAPAPADLLSAIGYSAYVQACGVGGCAAQGGSLNNGYAGPVAFTIDLPRPTPPQNLRVEMTGTQPVIRWDDQPNVLRSTVILHDWTRRRTLYTRDEPIANNPRLTCDGTTCTYLPDYWLFNDGSYSVWVNAIGPGGPSLGGPLNSGFSGPLESANTREPGDFVIDLPIPAPATEITAPTGMINAANPTFTWPTVADATYYRLWVGTSVPFTTRFVQWLSAGAATCTPHPGVCRYTPALNLPPNPYAWSLLTAGPGGVSTWGVVGDFTVSGSRPGAVTVTAPTGDTAAFSPTLLWEDIPIAERYEVWVGSADAAQTLHLAQYARADVCSGGVCTLTLSTLTLRNDLYLWNIRAGNAAGNGPWLVGGQPFVVAVPPPGAPALITPADDTVIYATNRPTFTWETVPHSRGYILEVLNSSGGVVYQQTHFVYAPECSAVTSCTVQFPNTIGYGAYRWRVTPGNMNEAGTPSVMWDFFTLSYNTQPLTVDSSDARMQRAGDWVDTASDRALGSGYLINSRDNDALTLTFQGTQVDVLYVGAPGYGRFTIEIDGAAFQTVEASTFEVIYGQIATVRGLPEGVHTLRLMTEGTVAVDAVLIDGEVIEPAPTAAPTPLPAPTAEATPETVPTTVPTPEGTPEATPEATLEATPEAEVTAAPTPEATPESTAQP